MQLTRISDLAEIDALLAHIHVEYINVPVRWSGIVFLILVLKKELSADKICAIGLQILFHDRLKIIHVLSPAHETTFKTRPRLRGALP